MATEWTCEETEGVTQRVKKVGLVVKSDPNATRKADEFEAWLRSQGVTVVRKKSLQFNQYPCHEKASRKPSQTGEKESAPRDLFCVFVLGGDGTFLSAARWIGEQETPMIGIKFGEVGFLAAAVQKHLFTTAKAILDNNFRTESRTRIEIRVIRRNKTLFRETALNDVVINKIALARLAHIKTYIDNQYLTTFRSDGLIVSTPTGSTAYSLSAGGPIMHPCVPGLILTPICPFTLTNRPLILSDSAQIKIELADLASDMMLTVDGQECFDIQSDDMILVNKGKYPVNMIVLPEQNYFTILKTKLRWSGGPI